MKELASQNYSGRLVKKPKFVIILAGSKTKTISLTLKNIGIKPWFDSSLKKVVGPEKVVGPILSKGGDDFILQPGPEKDHPNRVFGKGKHRVEFGQTVEVPMNIAAKKYTMPGKYKIGIQLSSSKSGTITDPIDVTIFVWRPLYLNTMLRDVTRAIKLSLFKKGSIDYSTKSKVFSKLQSKQNVAVVMCTWKRIENLPQTIKLLREQTRPVPLYIWNNNQNIRENIDELVAKENKLPVKVNHSSFNIGGYGRFYQSKRIMKNYDYVIFIDDDQTFEKSMVKDLLKEAKPKSMYSQWAFVFKNKSNYWRKHLAEKNEQAKYMGTCGMITDTQIFKNKNVFKCPKRFWFIEDLWLSYVADTKGWQLRRSNVKFFTHEDNKDQMNELIFKKTRMLKYLVREKRWLTKP